MNNYVLKISRNGFSLDVGLECEIVCETTGDYVKVTGKRGF